MNIWLRASLTAVLIIAAAAQAKPLEDIRVLALVSGHALTTRQVWLDSILEDPRLFVNGKYRAKDVQNPALERVITQYMVLEESRLIGGAKVSDKTLNEELFRVKKDLGPKNWPQFLADFDVRELDIRKRLEEKSLVQQAIESRVKVLGNLPDGPKRQQAITEAVQTWLSQLRSRYRVQRLHSSEESHPG